MTRPDETWDLRDAVLYGGGRLALVLRRHGHHSADIVGWHTAKVGERWAAPEPMCQGVRHAFGRFAQGRQPALEIRKSLERASLAELAVTSMKEIRRLDL